MRDNAELELPQVRQTSDDSGVKRVSVHRNIAVGLRDRQVEREFFQIGQSTEQRHHEHIIVGCRAIRSQGETLELRQWFLGEMVGT